MRGYRKILETHVKFEQEELDAGEYADTMATKMNSIMGEMIGHYEKTGILEYEIIVRAKTKEKPTNA